MKVSQARNGRDYVLKPEDSKGGFKGPESYMCDAVGGRWVHAQHGYVMSPTQTDFAIKALSLGWSAGISFSTGPFYLKGKIRTHDGRELTYAEAKKEIKKY